MTWNKTKDLSIQQQKNLGGDQGHTIMIFNIQIYSYRNYFRFSQACNEFSILIPEKKHRA